MAERVVPWGSRRGTGLLTVRLSAARKLRELSPSFLFRPGTPAHMPPKFNVGIPAAPLGRHPHRQALRFYLLADSESCQADSEHRPSHPSPLPANFPSPDIREMSHGACLGISVRLQNGKCWGAERSGL